MSQTVQQIANRALRLLGQISSGDTPSTNESNDCLTAFNAMVDSWNTERLSIYAIQEESLTLSAATASYTIGSGGVLNTVRPVKIATAYVLDGGISYPVELIQQEQYISILLKTSTSSWPTVAYYDANDATGLATLYVYPVPNATRTLKLGTWVPLSSTATLSTSIALPPGYERALVYNLAIEVAPEFTKPVPPEVMQVAAQAKGNIKRANMRTLIPSNDLKLMFPVQHANILAGE